MTGHRAIALAAAPRPLIAEETARKAPARVAAATAVAAEKARSVVATTPTATMLPPPTHAAREPELLGSQHLLSGVVTPAASSAASMTGGGGGSSSSTAAKLSELRSKLERSLRSAEEGLNAELELLDQRLQSHRQSVVQRADTQASFGTEGWRTHHAGVAL